MMLSQGTVRIVISQSVLEIGVQKDGQMESETDLNPYFLTMGVIIFNKPKASLIHLYSKTYFWIN